MIDDIETPTFGSQRPLEGLKPRNMPENRQFAVEMTLGERSRDIWNGMPLSASELGKPHRTRLSTFPQRRPLLRQN